MADVQNEGEEETLIDLAQEASEEDDDEDDQEVMEVEEESGALGDQKVVQAEAISKETKEIVESKTFYRIKSRPLKDNQ